MSSDLISRQILIQRISKRYDIQYRGYSFGELVDCIKTQSIAYDVDKVVEQIKYIGTAYCSSVGCDNDCSNCDHGVIMREIIKVVRKGGVEE